MAYIKYSTNKNGILQARIQASGKNLETGEHKIYTKTILNTNGLTTSKFHKQAEKEALDFESEIRDLTILRIEPVIEKEPEPVVAKIVEEPHKEETKVEDNANRVLTFNELYQEWLSTIKATLSANYYRRALELERFNDYLKEKNLYDKPISVITVRDVQLFLNSFSDKTYKMNGKLKVVLKKPLPKTISFRYLAEQKILDRCSSYNMNNHGSTISLDKAKTICSIYKLDLDEYFTIIDTNKHYSIETIKGYRRMLRTVFNEAIRYEWMSINPASKTKIGASTNNTALKPVGEKEVFSFKETKDFIAALDMIPKEDIYKKIPIKLMLLTGIRNAELHGLKWSNIDFENKLIHICTNRIYVGKQFGTIEKEPKTKTSKRDIPLPETMVDDLKEYYKWFDMAVPDFSNNLDKYYIASSIYREPEFPGTTAKRLEAFEKENNFKLISCHGLRHTYCSLLLSNNVPIQTVSKYMGHSDSAITLKVYSHFIPDTQEKVRNVLDSFT